MLSWATTNWKRWAINAARRQTNVVGLCIGRRRTMAEISIDRFYADKEATFCGLNVAQSFEQLR